MKMISLHDTVSLFNTSASSEESYDTTADLYGLFSSANADQKAQQWKISQFEATPKMSTYIVAYANGRLESLQTTYTSPLTGKTIPLRVYGSFFAYRFSMVG